MLSLHGGNRRSRDGTYSVCRLRTRWVSARLCFLQLAEYATLLPFVRDGLERGERAYHVLPARYRQEHLDQLRSAGIDVRAAQQRRQLEVATPEEVYLRNGRFSKEAMLEVIQEALKAGPTLGFPLTRLIAHAEAVL